jgi:hypothetical protein
MLRNIVLVLLVFGLGCHALIAHEYLTLCLEAASAKDRHWCCAIGYLGLVLIHAVLLLIAVFCPRTEHTEHSS